MSEGDRRALRQALAELTHGMDQREGFVRDWIQRDLAQGGLFQGGATRELIESLNAMINNGNPRDAVIGRWAS